MTFTAPATRTDPDVTDDDARTVFFTETPTPTTNRSDPMTAILTTPKRTEDRRDPAVASARVRTTVPLGSLLAEISQAIDRGTDVEVASTAGAISALLTAVRSAGVDTSLVAPSPTDPRIVGLRTLARLAEQCISTNVEIDIETVDHIREIIARRP